MATQIDEFLCPTEQMVSMDPDIKAEWVADLRSGEYAQGMGYLCKTDEGFCCLGVLSEQAVRKGAATKQVGVDLAKYFANDNSMGEVSSLGKGIATWAGVTYIDEGKEVVTAYGKLPFKLRPGIDGYGGGFTYLDDLNDSGMPFSQIADLIEFWY